MTELNAALAAAGVSLHVAATGAAAGVQGRLWERAGASAFLSGCSFPYAAEETAELLGFAPERLCSEETAIDLASAAYMKAYRLGGKAPVGLGVTCAVATNRERRGAERAHVCVIARSVVRVAKLELEPGTLRAVAGAACDEAALALLGGALGLGAPAGGAGTDGTSSALARFLGRPYLAPDGSRHAGRPEGRAALMPGAFNPPHEGHLGIASEVEREHGLPVIFHVTANAPHKAPLSVQELLERAKLLRGERALFTRGEALYIEKARRFPGTPLVMGADALLRMLDPKWGPEVPAMLAELAALGTTFFVSPRDGITVDACFARFGLGSEFRGLFTELSGAYASSSTSLRLKLIA
jgi:nicotinamide mononucleotide (NMN) deamidase PncC